jgi:hypothetical protein
LQGWLASPAARVVIWTDGSAQGFAILREIGDPSGRVELFRIALDQAGGGRGDTSLRRCSTTPSAIWARPGSGWMPAAKTRAR